MTKIIAASIKERICSQGQHVGASQREVMLLLPAFATQAMATAGFKYFVPPSVVLPTALAPTFMTEKQFLEFISTQYKEEGGTGAPRHLVERALKNATVKNYRPGPLWRKQPRGQSKIFQATAKNNKVKVENVGVESNTSGKSMVAAFHLLSSVEKTVFFKEIEFVKEVKAPVPY